MTTGEADQDGDGATTPRSALVTGATGGVGTSVARHLARSGFSVTVVGRSTSRVDALVDSLAPLARSRPRGLVADLADVADAERMFREAIDGGVDVDVVVNAAGAIGPIAAPADLVGGDLDHVMRLNCTVPVALCALALGPMLERGWGRLINITSAHSLHPPDSTTLSYGASKAALNFATRAIAQQLDGSDVAACVVHPGDLKTAMWDDIRTKATKLGPAGAALVAWADDVGRTGGDDLGAVATSVAEVVDRDGSWSNGRFVYAHGTQHHHPPPTW